MLDKRVRIPLVALLVTGLVVLVGHSVPLIRLAENLLYDLRIGFVAKSKSQSSGLVIVGITEETLSKFPYRSPIDREFLARLLIQLNNYNARAIGLDVLIDQKTEAQKDALLKRTLTALKTPLVAAAAGVENGLTQSQSDFLNDFLGGVKQGSVAVIEDPQDGVVRRIPIKTQRAAPMELSFFARIAEAAGIDVPKKETLAIDFKFAPDAQAPLFPIYPAHAVEVLPPEWFSGKIVLIGFELGFEDRHSTPLTRIGSQLDDLSGIQIHAQALAQILEGRKIIEPVFGWRLAIAFLFALLGLAFAVTKLSLWQQIATGVVLLLSIWVGGAALFFYGNIMIKILPPNLALLLSFVLAVIYQWRREQIQRQFIHDAFSKYLSRSYVDQLVANPDQLRVSGEYREVTFLFSDLAGFTPLTERLEPEQLVSVINEYLDKTCEIVTRHGGMIACVVGDALHVMFNAPVYQPDHAQRALDTAIELDAMCKEFEAFKQSQGIPLGITRIGINTGLTVVGNFGGKERIEYTAMGDAINTAARLESVNKYLGTRICVSESTMVQTEGFKFRPVGNLILEGKTEGVMVFEPMVESTLADINLAEYMQAYEKMEQQYSAALNAFKSLSAKSAGDSLVSFHLNRLNRGESGTTIVMEKK